MTMGATCPDTAGALRLLLAVIASASAYRDPCTGNMSTISAGSFMKWYNVTRVAILVPVHPPKIPIAVRFARSHTAAGAGAEADLYFISSNENDRGELAAALDNGAVRDASVKHLVLRYAPEHGYLRNMGHVIPTVKKFMALAQLYDDVFQQPHSPYRWSVICDSEVVWARPASGFGAAVAAASKRATWYGACRLLPIPIPPTGHKYRRALGAQPAHRGHLGLFQTMLLGGRRGGGTRPPCWTGLAGAGSAAESLVGRPADRGPRDAPLVPRVPQGPRGAGSRGQSLRPGSLPLLARSSLEGRRRQGHLGGSEGTASRPASARALKLRSSATVASSSAGSKRRLRSKMRRAPVFCGCLSSKSEGRTTVPRRRISTSFFTRAAGVPKRRASS